MIDVIEELLKADIESLKNPKRVAELIRLNGLHYDPHIKHLYDKKDLVNLINDGMIQIPEQLAEALVWLSDKSITQYVEVGTFNGKSTVFISAYLSRFNPVFRTLTIDNSRNFENPYKSLTIASIKGTSDDVAGLKSDLCLIDGDHSFAWIKRDYENLGKNAKYCMFHDILETEIIQGMPMDVKSFWNSIKRPSSVEFTYGGRMGIGIL